MKRFIIGSLWDRSNRNGTNANFKFLFESREHMDKLIEKAEDSIRASEGVQKQLDGLVIESGNANAEVSQARGSYDLLYQRLNGDKAALEQMINNIESNETKNQSDFMGMLHKLKSPQKVLYRVIRDRRIEIFVPQYGEYGTMFQFFKNTNEDFIRMGFADYSRMQLINGYYQNKNYDTLNGTWDLRNAPNYFTTEVGATVEVEFEGTGIDFLHFADNRGGVFEFSVDGEIVKSISTHIDAVPSSELESNYAIRSVVKGLENKKHILVGTFKGADTSNPPVGTARGWMRYAPSHLPADYNFTFHVHGPVHRESKIKNIIHSGSVKEFALSVNDGNDNVEWIPEHNSKGSTRALSQEILIDGVKVTDFTEMKHFGSANVIVIKQKLIGFHPNIPNDDVCEITSTHSITSSGVSVFNKIKWLKSVMVHDGYSMMLPVLPNATSRLFTSNDVSIATTKSDNSFVSVPKGADALSFAFTTTDDYATILKVENINKSYRLNENEDTFVQLQHRTDMQKLYPTVYQNEQVEYGDVYTASYHYDVGKIANVQDLLI